MPNLRIYYHNERGKDFQTNYDSRKSIGLLIMSYLCRPFD